MLFGPVVFTAVTDAFDAALSDPNLGAMMLQDADKAYEELVVNLQGGSALSRMAEQKAHRDLDGMLVFMQSSQAVVLLVAVVAGGDQGLPVQPAGDGAEVVIQLPLAAISLPDPGATAHHGRH